MAVTEVATLPLKAGINIHDKSSHAGKAWDEVYVILARQDGFQESWYGQKEESPDVAQLFINWKSLGDHQAFMASSDYQPMLDRLGSLMSSAPELVHFEVSSSATQARAFNAPITELVLVYLDGSSSTIEANLQKFADALEKDAQAPVGGVYLSGYSVEEVEHEKLDGGKGKVILMAIGWQSLEAHMAFRDTAAFKENVGLLRDGPKALAMHHVKMQAY